MVEALLLGEDDIDDVIRLYSNYAPHDLRSPKDPLWIRSHIGIDLFIFGVRHKGELIAVAWVAEKKDFVYFTISNDHLILKNDGNHFDSGGFFIRPDYQGRGLLRILTAAIFTPWFARMHITNPPDIWGRMMGHKSEKGNPLFWKEVGEKLTRISYHSLLEPPFGVMEKMIWDHWPRDPIPLVEIPAAILEQTLGVSFGPLIESKNRLISWGFTEVMNRYVPTSLNHFMCATKENFLGCVGDPERFFEDALSQAKNSLKNV
ncbi:MAG: hypothetical protein HY445_00305 [Candidatus Niyogibacteria bacterium]|nr:hypothetical protein [Candidatus Niyogibacteria bacterium]